MKTAIIVQARMTSTRLPGKILMPVLGKPLLEYQIERLRRVRLADAIIIATTTNAADDAVAACCERLGIACTRGSEHDVLGRYHAAALQHGADTIVRVTSDCPVIDPALIDEAIGFHHAHAASVDYVSNGLIDTYPRGMDVEVFTFAALAQAHAEARDDAEREHVTPFLYRRPQRFRLHNLASDIDLAHHRWTVDTPADFALIERIIGTLYPTDPTFDMGAILRLMAAHPDWAALNATVRQKPVADVPTTTEFN